jgi:putative ABC transport system permease protein
MLRALPGTAQVASTVSRDLQIVGERDTVNAVFFRQDPGKLAPRLVKGHWPNGAAQVAVNGQVLKARGLHVGDQITLQLAGRRARAQIVGDFMAEGNIELAGDRRTLALLDPGARADGYLVRVTPGTNTQIYSAKVRAGDPSLDAFPAPGSNSGGARLVDGAALLFTLMLGTVAALGVFNTVVLNTRERRRDLGMLKSIGMTPRQLIGMLLTSMGVIGALGGLLGVPLGIAAHQFVVPAMVHSGQLEVPDFLLNVFDVQLIVALCIAGIAIAVIGALIPARSAAWSPIAEVLRSE